MTTTTFRPASDKQNALIARLAVEKDLGTDADFNLLVANSANLDVKAASDLIDTLFSLPKKAVLNTDGAPISEGYFWVNGLVYKVQKSQTGNLYTKVFSEHGYTYAPGGIRLIATATRLTLEQAAELGVKTGRCVICGKTLTDPASVEAGIGPVCALRF